MLFYLMNGHAPNKQSMKNNGCVFRVLVKDYRGEVPMEIVAHAMEHCGDSVHSCLKLRNYLSSDYNEYKRIYEECFHEMRTALKLFPVNCCDSEEELLQKSRQIFILEINSVFIGSVAVYGDEIDDLIVAKEFQRKGYGEKLLKFAISYMQTNGISPICLGVAGWNQVAIKMYLKNGFKIVKTEIVK